MGLKARQVEARKIAAERGWTLAMPLEQRRQLSDEDWRIFVDAFSESDRAAMPAHVQQRFDQMIQRHEAVQQLSQGA